MADVLREYLVSIGFAQDSAGLRKFQDTLRGLSQYVERYTTHPIFGIGAMFTKMGLSAAGALAAIDASLVGLMAHTARSDLDMQLFARRMFMSTEAARSMKMATDALGVSLEDIIWGPPELRNIYQQMIKDQQRVAGGMDWEKQMLQIRLVTYQLDRLWLNAQRFAMMFAGDLSKMLFGDRGDLESNLKQLNEKFIEKMPELSKELATNVVPLLKATWQALKDIATTARDIVTLFTTNKEA